MKDKKIHEVENVLNFLLPKINKYKIDLVLDIGCGKGYTSYIIAAADPDIRVYGIDGNKANIDEFDRRVKKIATIHSSRISSYCQAYPSRFTLKTLFVDSQQIEKIGKDIAGTSPILIALHGCGNLSPTLVRMFANLKTMRQFFLVSCCFNLLTEKISEESRLTNAYKMYSEHVRNDLAVQEEDTEGGFPMSEYMCKRHPEFFLGRMIRHSAAASFAFLIEEPNRTLYFTKMLYRSALEVLSPITLEIYARQLSSNA
jgi:SAM-dependent methyltransferase